MSRVPSSTAAQAGVWCGDGGVGLESAARAVALALALVYAVSLVPGVRQTSGFLPLVDGWLYAVVDTTVIVLVLLRAGE